MPTASVIDSFLLADAGSEAGIALGVDVAAGAGAAGGVDPVVVDSGAGEETGEVGDCVGADVEGVGVGVGSTA